MYSRINTQQINYFYQRQLPKDFKIGKIKTTATLVLSASVIPHFLLTKHVNKAEYTQMNKKHNAYSAFITFLPQKTGPE